MVAPDADAHPRRLVAATGGAVEQCDAVGTVTGGKRAALGEGGREGRAFGHGGDLESRPRLAQTDYITRPEDDRGFEAAVVDVGAVAAAEVGQTPGAVLVAQLRVERRDDPRTGPAHDHATVRAAAEARDRVPDLGDVVRDGIDQPEVRHSLRQQRTPLGAAVREETPGRERAPRGPAPLAARAAL